MKTFNPFDETLLNGINLIEASAGTGKTYSMTTLTLRLILERDLCLAQILAVTFTDAAAAELKSRIRSRIRDAYDYATGKTQGTQSDFDKLFKKQDRDRCINRLSKALTEIDAMPVFTIHSFCNRMLNDFAFETAQPFGVDVTPDNYSFFRELACDFRRKLAVRFPAEILLQDKLQVDALTELAIELSKPMVTLEPPSSSDAAAEKEKIDALDAKWTDSLGSITQKIIDEAKSILLDACGTSLNGTSYKEESVKKWFKNLELLIENERPVLELSPPAEQLSTEFIQTKVKKGQTAPVHDLFDTVQNLRCLHQDAVESIKDLVRILATEFEAWLKEEASKRKRKRGILFYDDLLLALHHALTSPSGAELARQIRERFPVALIDEFQDTDQIQWGIFSAIYPPDQLDPGTNCLLLIGDPKQSIYSFRDADIEIYLDAKQTAGDRVWSMDTNYRSEPSLIEALNFWAASVGESACFNLPGKIDYVPIRAKNWTGEPTMEFAPGDTSLMFLPDPAPDGNKNEVIQEACFLVAKAVQHVLTHNRLDNDPLRPGQLAVLVQKHFQAGRIKAALDQEGIPSVIVSQKSVYLSDMAKILHHLLCCILTPSDEKLLRGLLLQDAFACTAAQIEGMDDQEWTRRVQQIRDWGVVWKEMGIAALLEGVDQDAGISVTLASQREHGERLLADFRHLAELLATCEQQYHLSPPALLRWIEQRMQSKEHDSDENTIRLESDDQRVQVVTIHSSKGLEYPVVFCPFLWEGMSNKTKIPKIYSEDGTRHYDWNGDYEDLIKEQQTRENLRLHYVAITRARHQLWICAAIGGKTNKHAPLHHWNVLSGPDAALKQCAHIRTADAETVQKAQWHPVQPPELTDPPVLSRPIRQNWLLHSYSSLAGENAPDAFADHDQTLEAEKDVGAGAPEGVFALPKGATFGTQVHDLLEQLDFQADASTRQSAIDRLRERAGYSEELAAPLLQLLNQTLDTPLAPKSFCLADIPPSRRLVELEFHFPVSPFERRRLASTVGAAVRFPSDICAGFIKGFVDLIFEQDGMFWIADYKTNDLGWQPSDYSDVQLRRAMQEHGYVLQYHLYTLALHRYLRLKMPDYDYDRHVGGAFYLFVRGMDGSNGVFFDRVEKSTIDSLDTLFSKGGG